MKITLTEPTEGATKLALHLNTLLANDNPADYHVGIRPVLSEERIYLVRNSEDDLLRHVARINGPIFVVIDLDTTFGYSSHYWQDGAGQWCSDDDAYNDTGNEDSCPICGQGYTANCHCPLPA